MGLPEAGGVGKGNWMKAVKWYKLPVTRNVIYNMTNIINTAEHCVLKLVKQ